MIFLLLWLIQFMFKNIFICAWDSQCLCIILLNSDRTYKFLSKNKSDYEHKIINIKIQISILPISD